MERAEKSIPNAQRALEYFDSSIPTRALAKKKRKIHIAAKTIVLYERVDIAARGGEKVKSEMILKSAQSTEKAGAYTAEGKREKSLSCIPLYMKNEPESIPKKEATSVNITDLLRSCEISVPKKDNTEQSRMSPPVAIKQKERSEVRRFFLGVPGSRLGSTKAPKQRASAAVTRTRAAKRRENADFSA